MRTLNFRFTCFSRLYYFVFLKHVNHVIPSISFNDVQEGSSLECNVKFLLLYLHSSWCFIFFSCTLFLMRHLAVEAKNLGLLLEKFGCVFHLRNTEYGQCFLFSIYLGRDAALWLMSTVYELG